LGQAGLVLVGTDEQFANWKMAIEIVGWSMNHGGSFHSFLYVY
jgi:uncharacterized protein YbdZ (MbtH family)